MSVPENKVTEIVKEKNIVSKAVREIFFIDDDKDELIIFDMAMQELNISFNRHYEKSGDGLLKLMHQQTPDLIFLDLHMPGKSGITCLKMLRFNNDYDSIPIIIYSKLAQKSFIDDCYQAKANYYLIKPVSLSKLTKAIHKVIQADWNAERQPARENFVIEE